jgi:hypothetical protein
MSNVAEIETIYRIAMDDSGGPEQWAGLCPSERSKRMYAVMRRLDRAGMVTPPGSGPQLSGSGARPDC